jgi:pimeloyl-ACP methyl ester carboxylesterase
MKTFFNSFVAILFLLICGCSTTPDNTAVSSDGVKIVFNKQGSGEPAVIFIHGWSNDKSIWDAQMNYFSKKYESVAIDLTGFGESGSNRKDLPDGKAGWTINAFANDVSAVIDKLDLQKVVLVGFSMGGPVAVETANLIPGKVAGIVLVDNLQDVDQKVPEQAISKVVAGMMDLVNNPSVRKLVSGGFVKKDSLKAFDKVLSMLDNPKTGWEESLTATIEWQNDECTQSLSELKVPVVAINSERMPTNVETFRKYVPAFKADIVPGVGHVIMWDTPKKFNELLEKDIKLFM